MSEFSDYMDATLGSTPVAASLPAAPFTPTRAIVRAGYVAITTEADSSVTETEAGAEFDRWEAEVKAAAWDEGRESIGTDLTRPLREDGTRAPTPNPHRTP